MRDKWLTPETIPAERICRILFIPASTDWLALVSGALLEMTLTYNWEQFGTVTPEQAVEAASGMFDAFSQNQGVCRVIGEIVTWAGSTSPDPNWLLCDGSSLVRADYPDLFAVIGVIYGSVDGTHFNLPDLQGRVGIGAGSGAGLSTYTLGANGGEEAHTLVTAETPSHSHADTGHTHPEGIAAPAVGAALVGVPIPSAIPAIGVTAAGFANLANSGADGAHNNLQPYLALNYLIVAKDG